MFEGKKTDKIGKIQEQMMSEWMKTCFINVLLLSFILLLEMKNNKNIYTKK